MAADGDSKLTLRELIVAITADATRSARTMAVRGEGTERDFRSELFRRLLIDRLGWAHGRVSTREIFDLVLFGERSQPICYVETKGTAGPWTPKDEHDFKARLGKYPSLRCAYLTNGAKWLRVDLFAPNGIQRLGEQVLLDVHAADDERVEQFFRSLRPSEVVLPTAPSGPLQTSLGFDTPPVPPEMLGRNRSRLSSDNAEATRWFTERLTNLVAVLSEHFVERFTAFRRGVGGSALVPITVGLFRNWCRQSLMPTPEKIVEEVVSAAAAEHPSQAIVAALRSLGFLGTPADKAADELASKARRRIPITTADETLWTLLADAVAKFASQTAHVVLARLLLYRVGEDKELYPRRISGKPWADAFERAESGVGVLRTRPAVDLAHRIRTDMEEFLPTVYLLGPFDWWRVAEHTVPRGDPEAIARLAGLEDSLEAVFKRVLDDLDSFEMSAVDFDVWQTIYQYYLPADERQRLGGFYTPQELVELVLDAAGFEASRDGLCQCMFIDPASGSGTFVVAALRRLLAHLDLELPCHAEFNAPGLPEWERSERIARLAAGVAHAVDIHPFAAFLTTINMLFQILPHYVTAHRTNPRFVLSLPVFAADSLELPEAQGPSAEQVSLFNSRIQQAEDSAKRYREKMSGRTFDLVVGNPPWGGVLKGPLAPVFDEARKERLREHYPATTDGKFDIFGPFIEHALRLLREGGRFALVTQGSYFDKEWAGLLRAKLSSTSRLERIIDMNPFGQLLFGAMNIPSVTVAMRRPPDDGDVHVVLCGPASGLRDVPESERKARLMEDAGAALRALAHRRSSRVGIARGHRVPRKEFRDAGTGRWPVCDPPTASVAALESYEGLHLLDYLDPSQGVTPGGVLDLFLMRSEDADRLKLEGGLIQRALKSRDLGKWRAQWDGRVLLYPYRRPLLAGGEGPSTIPAFTIEGKVAAQSRIADALDFEHPADDREVEILREHGWSDAGRKEILQHRVAAGLVPYPNIAKYLTDNYDRLSGRVFKKRNIRTFGRRWYEYLWPRNATVMIQKPRLICPGLAKHVRFVLDDVGYLSDHACFLLVPVEKTRHAFEGLHLGLNAVLERRVTKADALRYVLAFANSSVAQDLLRHARRPRPGEVYQYDKSFLREIPVPDPTSDAEKARRLVDLVTSLTEGEAKDVPAAEAELDEIARSMLFPASPKVQRGKPSPGPPETARAAPKSKTRKPRSGKGPTIRRT